MLFSFSTLLSIFEQVNSNINIFFLNWLSLSEIWLMLHFRRAEKWLYWWDYSWTSFNRYELSQNLVHRRLTKLTSSWLFIFVFRSRWSFRWIYYSSNGTSNQSSSIGQIAFVTSTIKIISSSQIYSSMGRGESQSSDSETFLVLFLNEIFGQRRKIYSINSDIESDIDG